MIYLCDKCKERAVWNYQPGPGDRYRCDEHVPRGCSCQTDDDGNPLKDSLGRDIPCCEWDYSPKGFKVYEGI
jgi:hypothetical protein